MFPQRIKEEVTTFVSWKLRAEEKDLWKQMVYTNANTNAYFYNILWPKYELTHCSNYSQKMAEPHGKLMSITQTLSSISPLPWLHTEILLVCTEEYCESPDIYICSKRTTNRASIHCVKESSSAKRIMGWKQKSHTVHKCLIELFNYQRSQIRSWK